MRGLDTQPHAQLRPSLWAGRLVLGRFVLALSVSREAGSEEAPGKITNRLESLRRERGWSCQECARLLHIHPSTLLAMENGSYLPRLPLALRLSELFHLPVEAIFSSSTAEYLA